MMELSLAQRRILITGGSQGVGKAIAEGSIRAGAGSVYLCGRDRDIGEITLQELSKRGSDVHFQTIDLANQDSPEHLFNSAVAKMGGVDCLVNAAGLTTRASFLDGEIEDWDMLFNVNARAPFFLMQKAIRHFLDRKYPGTIVNISSMNAHCGSPALAIYSATKGALSTLTKNAAHSHLSNGIRANAIAMGWAPTPAEMVMQGDTLGKGDDWVKAASKNLPLGRMLQSEEVANLAVYLLSDLSGLQTGTVIDLEQKVIGGA